MELARRQCLICSSPFHTPPTNRTTISSVARAFEPFSENAAQVKRLISRDRKQFLGNEGDILDKFETEFGEGDDEGTAAAAAPAAATATATVAPPAAAAAPAAAPPAAPKPASPFGSAGPSGAASPFGAPSSPSSPFSAASSSSAPAAPYLASAPGASLDARSKIEPAGLSPLLGPDPLAPAPAAGSAGAPGGFLARITLTQVVLFLSFSTIIGLMLATFRVAVTAGAIRLAGVE